MANLSKTMKNSLGLGHKELVIFHTTCYLCTPSQHCHSSSVYMAQKLKAKAYIF